MKSFFYHIARFFIKRANIHKLCNARIISSLGVFLLGLLALIFLCNFKANAAIAAAVNDQIKLHHVSRPNKNNLYFPIDLDLVKKIKVLSENKQIFADDAFKIIAIVEKRLISNIDVRNRINNLRVIAGMNAPMNSEFISEIIYAMLSEAAVERGAEKIGIQVSDEELTDNIASILRTNPNSQDIIRVAKRRGIALEQLVMQVKNEIIMRDFYRNKRKKMVSELIEMNIRYNSLLAQNLAYFSRFNSGSRVWLQQLEVSNDESDIVGANRGRSLAGKEVENGWKINDLGWLQVSELSPFYMQIISGMQPGETSAEFALSRGKIKLRVKAFENIDNLNFDTNNLKLREVCSGYLLKILFQNFVDEMLAKSFIYVFDV